MQRPTVPRRDAAARAPVSAAHLPAPRYARHVPERTLLYALVEAHYPDFLVRPDAEDRGLPEYVREEFEEYLRCGVLEHGFLRVACEHCHAERLVAFSCKKRGFCPSCGARRMAESARHLVDEVFGPRPVRQWVLSFPHPLRFLFASKPDAIGPRAHLTRFHGVFAPNAALRAQLTPSGRGKRPATDAEPADGNANDEQRTPEERRRSMTWAQRLKRVSGIDVNVCVHCGGAVRIVASVEEPAAIRAVLGHFEKHCALEQAHYRPAARAPPAAAA